MVEMTQSGTYALVLGIPEEVNLSIGQRRFGIPQGTCVYCGSAMGPGGVEVRVARHLRLFSGGRTIRKHWHIDRLLVFSSSVTAVLAHSSENTECALAQALESQGMVPVSGFGNTDCKSGCRSHLLCNRLNEGDTVREVAGVMQAIGLEPIVSGTLERNKSARPVYESIK